MERSTKIECRSTSYPFDRSKTGDALETAQLFDRLVPFLREKCPDGVNNFVARIACGALRSCNYFLFGGRPYVRDQTGWGNTLNHKHEVIRWLVARDKL